MHKPHIRRYIARWYLNGKSAAQIARQLSRLAGKTITRNAVIGLAHRMALCIPKGSKALTRARPQRAISLPLGQTFNPTTRRIERSGGE